MQFSRKVTDEQSSSIVTQGIYRFIPYWPLFLVLFAVGIAAAYTYLKMATPMYECTASLLIKDEHKGTEESKTVESLDKLSTKKIIENETEVIQSASLLKKVVNRLYLYAPVYREETLKNESAYSNSPVQIELASIDDITPVEKVYFTYNYKDSTVNVGGTAYPVNKWLETSYGKLKFKNNPLAKGQQQGKLFFSIASPKSIVSTLSNSLKVTTSNKMTSILNLTLTDEDPKKGEAILNELLTVYNEAILNEKSTLANNTLQFIEKRLQAVEHDLDSTEKKIQSFKSNSGAVDLSTQGQLFLQNVSANDQKMGDINMQMAVLNQVETFVNSKENGSGIVPSTLGVADPALSHLVEKLYSAELEYEQLKTTTAENNPILVSVADRIQKIRPGIIQNIESQRRSLVASRNNLSSTNSGYGSILRSMPEKERELLEINREQSIKNNIYNLLLQKREETALSYASTVSENQIINSAASSEKPVSPKKKIVYLASMLMALLAGMGFVYARESFSRKIMFRHEIEQLIALPIIGEISIDNSKNAIVVSNTKKTFIAEQFRKLRMSLSYMGISPKHKRIMVTSSISGEGKSFIATNLALTLALSNKKVVLLDFDLNNPTLSKKLNIAYHYGIADYLEGKVEADEILIQTGDNPNFYMIPPGSLPYNPTELIMNGKTEELLNYLDTKFDYIIIDTAPVVPVTDAYILSPLCDVTLFVVKHGFTPKVFIERLDENNKINHLNNAAIVFNGVTPRGFGSSHYGYGYGYGYIYDDSQNTKRLAYRN